jgi:hypothetical protein
MPARVREALYQVKGRVDLKQMGTSPEKLSLQAESF